MKDDCTDIITRFIEILEQTRPDISRAATETIETLLRHEYAGESVYISRRRSSLRGEIVERFTGHNTAHIAREMNVSRRTVYRIIKAARKKKA